MIEPGLISSFSDELVKTAGKGGQILGKFLGGVGRGHKIKGEIYGDLGKMLERKGFRGTLRQAAREYKEAIPQLKRDLKRRADRVRSNAILALEQLVP